MKKMNLPEFLIGKNQHLSIEKFRKMDYLSVDKLKISLN